MRELTLDLVGEAGNRAASRVAPLSPTSEQWYGPPVLDTELEVHRAALTGHCYRMLGSVADAADAVQETMLRATRGLAGFDGRASLRTWLTRIATNVCLDALSDAKRRARPIEEGPAGTIDDELVARSGAEWLEPAPDARTIPADEDPLRLAVLRQSVRLAFVAALQHLPARQRAALLLADVLEWSAVEVAEALDMTPPAVNSALQRARATLAARAPVPEASAGVDLSSAETRLVSRFVDAFERYDVEALTSLCREDVAFSMPPFSLWLEGPAAVQGWLLGRGAACRGSRLVPLRANGVPAFGQYKPAAGGEHRAFGLAVLELEGVAIARWTTFLDVETLFPAFGLALVLPPG